MTNPGDIVRVRSRRGGRASVYEANAWCQAFTSGLLDGQGVAPNTIADLNVLVGGTPSCPDVVLAKNPAGYRIALDLVGQQAITITTPATNTRISSIVAYTDDLSLATTQNDVTGSPASCGLIVVNGAASANPVPPTETEIRAAITADGAAGSQASYAIIANVTVSATTSTITNTLIDIQKAALQNVDWATIYPVMKQCVPDYAKESASSLPYNSGFKITQTGFARIHVYGYAINNSHTLTVKVNNSVVWERTQEARAPNGASAVNDDFVIPVAKNDIITVSGTESNGRGCYQIPAKWA